MYLLKNPCFLAAWFRFVNWFFGFGFPLAFFFALDVAFFFWVVLSPADLVATFLLWVASFLAVASLDHFSRLRRLFKVPILTLCFSAKSLKVILLVSHSLRICFQFGFVIYIHAPPLYIYNSISISSSRPNGL